MDVNPEKDYYAILGVAPTAEGVVIKAAYKALMQRYHPDRMVSSGIDTTDKVAEINEAYKVLSDHQARKEYDQLRGVGPQSAGDTFDESEPPKESEEFIEHWRFACDYYPHLISIEKRLSKVSWRLALAFQATVLETKIFEEAEKIALAMEIDFLSTYFGANEKILNFAKELINSGNREAARELNKAIKIFGNPENPEHIIKTINNKFKPTKPKSPEQDKNDARLTKEEIIRLINSLIKNMSEIHEGLTSIGAFTDPHIKSLPKKYKKPVKAELFKKAANFTNKQIDSLIGGGYIKAFSYDGTVYIDLASISV